MLPLVGESARVPPSSVNDGGRRTATRPLETALWLVHLVGSTSYSRTSSRPHSTRDTTNIPTWSCKGIAVPGGSTNTAIDTSAVSATGMNVISGPSPENSSLNTPRSDADTLPTKETMLSSSPSVKNGPNLGVRDRREERSDGDSEDAVSLRLAATLATSAMRRSAHMGGAEEAFRLIRKGKCLRKSEAAAEGQAKAAVGGGMEAVGLLWGAVRAYKEQETLKQDASICWRRNPSKKQKGSQQSPSPGIQNLNRNL